MSASEAKLLADRLLILAKTKPPAEFGRETMICAAQELDKVAALKEAITELFRESPLLQGEPHEGSVTGRLVKKVLEAMK